MKRPIRIIAVFVACGVVVVGAAYFGASTYIGGKTSKDDHTCAHPKNTHTAVIQDNKVVPSHIDASRCDQLTISNQDDTLRLISFGQHNQHSQYDGVTEKRLSKDQSFTVTLRTTGEFLFHDHIHDTVSGTFSVSP